MQDLLVGKGDTPQYLHLPLANRHGLIAGATGTGKTITLQVLAEGFSRAGVPVFCADIKGDLAGIAEAGAPSPKLAQRAADLGMEDYVHEPSPVIFWDVFGKDGHPVRATVAEMGPVLLARILDLNETQEGVLTIAFALADDQGLLLLDFKDLRAMLGHVANQAASLTTAYGNVSKATVGAIQRKLLGLEQADGAQFFGEPALALSDLMRHAPDGRGAVSVLAADRLVRSPRLYATFLLWLMSELFEQMPEVGDLDRPKLVFFFDEAHLLFRDAPKSLTNKIEQVVRLIRSKGVGIYFIAQNPGDVPPGVLGQLGNRVQHALRAFTPVDQKSVRVAAETFRPNPSFKTETAITELAVGEALVSLLDETGVPGMVQRARICPPRGRIVPITQEERAAILRTSPAAGVYDQPIDRESAYERLQDRASAPVPIDAQAQPTPVRGGDPWSHGGAPPPSPWGSAATAPGPARPSRTGMGGQGGGLLSEILTGGGRRQGVAEAAAKSIVRSLGSQVGTQLGRAVLRGMFGSLTR